MPCRHPDWLCAGRQRRGRWLWRARTSHEGPLLGRAALGKLIHHALAGLTRGQQAPELFDPRHRLLLRPLQQREKLLEGSRFMLLLREGPQRLHPYRRRHCGALNARPRITHQPVAAADGEDPIHHEFDVLRVERPRLRQARLVGHRRGQLSLRLEQRHAGLLLSVQVAGALHLREPSHGFVNRRLARRDLRLHAGDLRREPRVGPLEQTLQDLQLAAVLFVQLRLGQQMIQPAFPRDAAGVGRQPTADELAGPRVGVPIIAVQAPDPHGGVVQVADLRHVVGERDPLRRNHAPLQVFERPVSRNFSQDDRAVDIGGDERRAGRRVGQPRIGIGDRLRLLAQAQPQELGRRRKDREVVIRRQEIKRRPPVSGAQRGPELQHRLHVRALDPQRLLDAGSPHGLHDVQHDLLELLRGDLAPVRPRIQRLLRLVEDRPRGHRRMTPEFAQARNEDLLDELAAFHGIKQGIAAPADGSTVDRLRMVEDMEVDEVEDHRAALCRHRIENEFHVADAELVRVIDERSGIPPQRRRIVAIRKPHAAQVEEHVEPDGLDAGRERRELLERAVADRANADVAPRGRADRATRPPSPAAIRQLRAAGDPGAAAFKERLIPRLHERRAGIRRRLQRPNQRSEPGPQRAANRCAGSHERRAGREWTPARNPPAARGIDQRRRQPDETAE